MVDWMKTTENPKAIINGLCPCVKDSIHIIGGSLDQGLALTQYAGKVNTAEIERLQFNYMKRQAELIEGGDFVKFLRRRLGSNSKNLDYLLKLELEKGTKYFTLERLKKIQERIGSLELHYCDIMKLVEEKEFNKIYLSNAFGGSGCPIIPDYIFPSIEKIKNKLPKKGLIYVANGETVWGKVKNLEGIEIDEILSMIARDENAHPLVLRKL